MKKIAVFASGTGSNMVAIHEAIQLNKLEAEIGIVVVDKPKAKVIEKANVLGIRTLICDPKLFNSKMEYEKHILNELNELNIDLIVLAGYMRLINPVLLGAYKHRIINIHPSLLPKYKGKCAIEQAYEANETVYGVTVHYVDEGMDTGEIIEQRSFEESSKDIELIERKIHEIEHNMYYEVIKKVLEEL